MLGGEERLVAELVGELRLGDQLAIEVGDAATAIGIVVDNRDDRELHAGPFACVSPSITK